MVGSDMARAECMCGLRWVFVSSEKLLCMEFKIMVETSRTIF